MPFRRQGLRWTLGYTEPGVRAQASAQAWEFGGGDAAYDTAGAEVRALSASAVPLLVLITLANTDARRRARGGSHELCAAGKTHLLQLREFCLCSQSSLNVNSM